MNDQSKNLFITGATGFIGKHLLKGLEDKGYKLYLLILPEESKSFFTGCNIEWVVGDLNDPGSYLDALSKCSMVIHMAAELYNPSRFELLNVKGVQNLIHSIKQCSVQKIIHLSSVGVVGMQFSSQRVTVDEETPCFPKNDYEKSKLKSEELFSGQIQTNQLVILRPSNVYGDYHPRNHLLTLFKHIMKNKHVFTSDNAYVNYVYAGDVATAIIFFIENPEFSGVYNVGGPLKMDAFMRNAALVLKKDVRIRILPSWIFSVLKLAKPFIPASVNLKILSLQNAVQYSDKKLRNLLNSEIGYKRGLKATAEYYISKKMLDD